MPLPFKTSPTRTIGVELELQIVNARDFNLSRGAVDLLERLALALPQGQVKPEITQGMIETNSSVHEHYETLLAELRRQRNVLVAAADELNLRIAGGGTHPFHRWSEQRIFPTPRFRQVSGLYGYLAKQFTVFGQHIHLGCADGEDALYVLQRLSRYVPHFIALAASSPFQQGVDTTFECSRLNVVSAFPLAGHAPPIASWSEFSDYFGKLAGLGVVESIKDLYWDIRPKPEYGTVEIRVSDTPLDVETSAALAAYGQALARYLRLERSAPPPPEADLVYSSNRFQACRFGLDGTFIDASTRSQIPLRDDVLETLTRLEPHAAALGSSAGLAVLRELTMSRETGAVWLRRVLERTGTLSDVVRVETDRWRGQGR
jgi:glutamate---cysteine ligase / carboxylate-amine ligase